MARPNNSRYERSILGLRDLSCTQYLESPSLHISDETNGKSAYYLPTSSISLPLTPTKKSTFCEWKGWATYYTITGQTEDGKEETVKDRIWSYETPNERFKDLKGYVSFYAGPWDCYVDGEEVKPQPGDFYGGWTTSELDGIIKGDAATRWM